MKLKTKKLLKLFLFLFIIGAVILIAFTIKTFSDVFGRTMIEIDIVQNQDLILDTVIGEPPQFAIWLEDPEADKVQTIFVTYRAGSGDWKGKARCRQALPYWYDVYQKEMNRDSIPTPDDSVPAAVTGATPKANHFRVRAEVEPGSVWDVWVEVNLAGDFNKYYTYYNMKKGMLDDHYVGQPSLVYKTRIKARAGNETAAELFAQSSLEPTGRGAVLEPVSEKVTTARDIFSTINIRVIRPKPRYIEKEYEPDPNLLNPDFYNPN